MAHADTLPGSPHLRRAARTMHLLLALPATALRVLWRVPAALAAMLALAVGVPLLTRAPGLQRRLVHRVCRILCAVLGLRIERRGAPSPGPALLAANHVSWLDTIVLVALADADGWPAFVAKAEVAGWPVIGPVGRRLGMCFIDRRNRFACYRSLPGIQAQLRRGPVAIFPEGTTTIGDAVAPLYPMLFETAVREGVPVQPVTLAYRTADGCPSRAAAFIGDDTLLESLGRVLLQREIRTVVHWGAPFHAEDRRSFARGTGRRLGRTLAALDGAAAGSRAGQGRPAPSGLSPAAVAPGPGTGAASTRTA
ncbi:MAG: lysophospholipid acyltransferase family protein [Pseudomonadales bacterium]|jgi:1-acyl-sn-glycerol-3-phosphate acyltransferase|nr:lysophospholipid acyltransferase family protein [Pseudomonadales bacterium]